MWCKQSHRVQTIKPWTVLNSASQTKENNTNNTIILVVFRIGTVLIVFTLKGDITLSWVVKYKGEFRVQVLVTMGTSFSFEHNVLVLPFTKYYNSVFFLGLANWLKRYDATPAKVLAQISTNSMAEIFLTLHWENSIQYIHKLHYWWERWIRIIWMSGMYKME